MSITPNDKLQCFVCNKPLPSFHPKKNSAQGPCCLSPDCLALANYLNNTPDSAHKKLHFQQQAEKIRSQRQAKIAQQTRENQIDLNLEKATQANIEELKQANPEFHNTQITSVKIPTCSIETEDLNDARRTNYKNHLKKVIKEALQEPPISDLLEIESRKRESITLGKIERKPEIKSILTTACMLCKGSCCTAGKDTALISLETIKKSIDYLQTSTPEEIETAYLNRLPEKVVINSCVHHSTEGCTLPSEMRSAICNGYYCEDLKKLITEDQIPLDNIALIRFGYEQWAKYTEGSDYSIRESVLIGDNK